MSDRPEIVCLCGSVRFLDRMRAITRSLTLRGVVVLGPTEMGGAVTAEEKTVLDAVHRHRIDLAHRVLVVNPGGHVGESTRGEIEYARAAGKPVEFTDPVRTAPGPTPTGPQAG